MSSSLASCGSDFAWMKNGIGQDPCTVAAWLIALGLDPSSNQPASIGPISSTSTGYLPPNGTSANAATCSWAFYNTIEACTVCQDLLAENYSSWSSSCNVLGQSSTTTYWQSSISFSNHTQLPRWSILYPSKWSSGTFNATQAKEIAGQNFPDVTDASASQPSLSSSSATASPSAGPKKKSDVGAIAGGVVAGVLVLSALGIALWFFVCRSRIRTRTRGPRKHVDLDADNGGILGEGDEGAAADMTQQGGNPLTAHLRSQSLSSWTTSPSSYYPPMHQGAVSPILGHHSRSQTLPTSSSASQLQGGQPANVVVGITRTERTSRDSIPTVAERLDEKRRIRAGRQNSSSSTGPLNRRGMNGYAGTVTWTGSSSRSTSMDDLYSGGISNSAVISHAISRSLSHSQSQSQSQISVVATAGESNTRASRRFSLKKTPWNRHSRTVVNVGSDAGSSPPMNSAPLPLNSTVAAAGHTATASDVIAAVPGARLPTARDRENPPPEYTRTSPT